MAPTIHLIEFAWPPGLQAEVVMTQRNVREGQGNDSELRIDARYRMLVSAHDSGLAVDYLDGELLSLESDPPMEADNPVMQMYEALNGIETRFVVTEDGQFVSMEGADAAAAAFRATLGSLLDSLPAEPEVEQTMQMFETMVSEDALTNAAAEQWGALVWTWAWEEFEEGMVYEAQSEEPSPLIPDMVIPMDFELALSERVACDDADTEIRCVSLELVSHPDADAVRAVTAEFMRRIAPAAAAVELEFVEFEQETYVNVVAELKTLIPYSFETTKSVRGVIAENGEETAFGRLDSTVLTFTYPAR